MSRFVRYVSATLFCFIIMVIAVYAFEGVRITPTVPAWQENMSDTYLREERRQGLDITGETPIILEYFGPAYAMLNDEIEIAVESLIEGTRRIRARSIDFEYEIFPTYDVVSVVIIATTRAVTDRTSVTSVNFDPRTGELMSLTDAMGMDITPLAEGIIADMIRQDPATFYAAFTAPPTGQAFYLTEYSLVLLFDEFQLSSVPGAQRAIELTLANIQVFTIPRYAYRISQDRYEIKMMPLRQILLSMGYSDEDIVWDETEKVATIMRNGRAIITLSDGENNFQLNGILQRSLEAAPEIVNNNMYVPISFFDQILGLTAYNIDEQGNIMFISYLR